MAIQALRAGVASGDKGLATPLLKMGGPGAMAQATTLIHRAITARWRAGMAEWKDACMHAVFKGRGSRTSMDASQSITVLNIDATHTWRTSAACAWTWRSGCIVDSTASQRQGHPRLPLQALLTGSARPSLRHTNA